MLQNLEKINTYGIPLEINPTWIDVKFPNAIICIQERPFYCNRGRYGIIVDNISNEKICIDWADGFPRYFFSLQRLFDELNDWILMRKEELTKV